MDTRDGRDHWLTDGARILRGTRAIKRQADYANIHANLGRGLQSKGNRTQALKSLIRIRTHADRLIGLLQQGAH